MSEKQPKKQDGQNQTPQRKDGMPYRPLSIPERDFLFALYDKHGGNMLAMTRDHDCIFRSHRQLSFYCHFYGFQPKLAERRQKRAEEVVAQLGHAKMRTIERAMEMMAPRQVPIVLRANGKEIPMTDEDGNVLFQEIHPSEKEIKTAWEIIKTEMGEPTSVSKTDVTTKGRAISGNAIAFVDMGAFQPADDPES